jgi:hypothetical protein
MSISPIGKRVAIARQVKTAQSEMSAWDNWAPAPTDEIEVPGGLNTPSPNAEKEKSDMSLTDFFVQKMTDFGYPYRLISERRSDLAEEEIVSDDASGGEIRRVKATLPAVKYPVPGSPLQEVRGKDITEISREVKERFSLKLERAKKEGKQWNLDFVSSRPEDEAQKFQDENIDPGEAILDEIYGNKKNKKASVNKSEDYWSKVSSILSSQDRKG